MKKRLGKKRQKKKDTGESGDLQDPRGFARRLADYLEAIERRNYSKSTIRRIRDTLLAFMRWSDERNLRRPEDITRPILERYARFLYYYRKPDGAPLSFRNQHNQLSALKLFFKYLTRQNFLLSNPASELELPKVGLKLPAVVLTIAEMDRVLCQPDIHTDLGIRDRAILETFYSTGMRRAELTKLAIYDLDVQRGTVFIRQGKGKKDRVVPIGERALDWIDRYITDVRPGLVIDDDDKTLYLTNYGEPFSNNGLSLRVARYIDAAEIGKRGACHLFRHTMATLMLEAGADVRFIQEMLGHASLSTTQLYTQVSIRKLKAIHEMTHPSAKRGRYQETSPSLGHHKDETSSPGQGQAQHESDPAPPGPGHAQHGSDPAPPGPDQAQHGSDPAPPVDMQPEENIATVAHDEAEALLASFAAEADEDLEEIDSQVKQPAKTTKQRRRSAPRDHR